LFRKTVSGILLFLLLVSTLTLAFNIQPVKAEGTIYIRADGSIDPPTAPIQRAGNLYTLTGNITSDADGIVIAKDNTTLDGAHYSVHGPGIWPPTFNGITLNGRDNVTIRNTKIEKFGCGIWVNSSSNIVVSENTLTNNLQNAIVLGYSSNNRIFKNHIKYTYHDWPGPSGIILACSSNNDVSENTLESINGGIGLATANNNSVRRNTIFYTRCGIGLQNSFGNDLSENNVTQGPGGSIGFNLYYSCNNSLSRNDITYNWCGIRLEGLSNNNIISQNRIERNSWNVWLRYSPNNNIFCHNNFVGAHGNQVLITDDYPVDVWDDGYPSGGNYWSDYAGVDANGDGIGDTPYVINDDNQDRYPLVNPWTPTSPWPMFLHDPKHTGRSPYRGPQTNVTSWIFRISDPGYCMSENSPVIAADGTVYIGGRLNNTEKFFAINPDGSLKWSFDVPYGSASGIPAVGKDGSVVFQSGGGVYYNGKLYCLNAENGTIRWIMGQNEGIPGLWAARALTIGGDGTIYGPFNRYLIAVAPNGTVKWSFDLGGLIDRNTPAIGDDGTIYMASPYHHLLYAFNPNGSIVWATQLGNYSGSFNIQSPAIGPTGNVFVAEKEKLYAVNPQGKIEWVFETLIDGQVFGYNSPTIGDDGVVYIAANIGSSSSQLYAINPDGTVRWIFSTEGTAYPDFICSSPAIGNDGTIYFGSHDYSVYAIDCDGNLKWKYKAGNVVMASPALSPNGLLLVSSWDGNLYAFGSWTPTPPLQTWLFDSDFQYDLDDNYGTVEGTGHLSGTATLSAGNLSIEGQITLNGDLPSGVPEVYLIATDGQDKELAKQAVDLNGFSYWQTGPNTYNFTGQIPNVIQPMNNGHYEAQALITYNTAKYEFFINTASLINSHYFPLTPPPIVPPVPPQPVNIEPPDGATDVSLEPLFLSSPPLSDVTSEQIPWEDIDGVEATRVYYRVQITTIPGDYSEPVYDFTDLWLIDKRFDFPPSPKRPYVSSGVLDSGTTYYWRIRYKDFRDVWSPWSQETSFTTVLPINEVVKRLIQQVRIIEKDTYVTIDEAQYIIVVLRQKIDPDTLSFIPDSGETVVYTDAEGYAISDGEVARKIGLIDIAQETVKELDLNEKINELKSVQSKLSSLNLRDLAWGGINLAATAGADIEKIVNEMTVLKRIGDSLTTIERIEDLAKTQPVGLLQETITYLMRKMIWDPYSEVKVTLDKALSDALNEYTQALNLLEQTSYKIEDFRTANEFLTRLYYGQVHEEVARHLEEKTFKNWGKLVLRILSVANLLQKIPIIKDIPGLDFVALVKEAADALDWLNDADYVHVVKSYEAQANLLYKLSDNAKYTLRLAQASAQVQEYTQKYLDHIAEGNQQGAKLLEEAIPFSSFSRFLDSLRSLKLPALFSPGELRVYDSQNRVTGLIYGHPSEEIPDSLYDDEINIIIIFNATDTYRYEVVGTDKGSYGLEISSIANGSVTTFNATDIPTSTNATHQYTIDWDVLSQGEEGVTVQVDSDGDGVFEHTFTSDSELTHDEFIQQTTPTYNLTITATIGGTTNPSPGMYTYTANSSVQVTAIPNADYLFDHWELDTVNVGSANPYTVLMDNNHTLKAVFTYSPPPPPLSASISPLSASILVGQSVTFTSTVSGGYPPYSYQWYLNGNPVSGATSDTWTFTPTTSGIFYIYLKIIDAKGNTAQSETARVVVYTVPVGGYSIPIQLPTTAKPVTLHIALLTILTALFIAIRQKTRRKHRQ